MTDVYIKLESIPSVFDLNRETDLGLPTEDELGFAYQSVDNQSPKVRDPANWFIFDAGDGTANTPAWVRNHNNRLKQTIASQSINGPENPGSSFPHAIYHGEGCTFSSSGGPRNKGYTNISDTTWWRINNYVPIFSPVLGYTSEMTRNEAWKEGSIEFTIKPDRANCVIASGTLFEGSGIAFSGPTQPPGRQSAIVEVKDGIIDGLTTGQKIELSPPYGIGPGEEKGYAAQHVSLVNQGGGIVGGTNIVTYPNPDGGINLTDARSSFRSFKVDLVNGIVRVSYEVYYGPNKKYIEFFGKTNIVDGEWHHVVVNRPSPFTLKTSEQQYEGDGCFEIWVDGQLEVRDFSIKTTEVLPVPMILFNDSMNAGILNWFEYIAGEGATNQDEYEAYAMSQNPQWKIDALKKTNYVGGIRDFIFRQSIALSPHSIGLNYVYSMLNTEFSCILKSKKLTATANILQPSITTSKPKILKIYWNNLLKDKTKNLNGLEFDENYQVYSCSITHKNLISPTQTFNLDLNPEEQPRKYFTNVRAAIGRRMFVPFPNIFPTSVKGTFDNGYMLGLSDIGQLIDTEDDQRVLAEAYPGAPWYLNNILFGGVSLVAGDRILLFNQPKKNENGIWIYNGPFTALSRPTEIDAKDLRNGHVYVEQGKYANKTFVQTENVTHIRKSAQIWREIDNDASLSTLSSYPIYTTPWTDEYGNARFIDVNTDIDFDYDIIAFMNFPTQNKEIVDSLFGYTDIKVNELYKEFIENLKSAVAAGKSLYVSSPMLAIDLGIVDSYVEVDQMLDEDGDAQSASISPFESGEVSSNYFDTHRNIKYHLATEVPGLTDRETYILSDFVTYSPDRINSDYHIKYNYRQFGLQEGDEFYIPGVTTVPETLNGQLPGYLYNQRGTKPLAAFPQNSINLGTMVTKFSNTVYDGSTAINNPYDDYATTIAAEYGSGKIFVNCVENGYAFSRSDYNTGIIQNVTAGQNSETVQTAAWQYSTKRLNKKNLYDFSEISNLIGQTTPTTGGGGAIVQSQSHCSNGLIRKKTNEGDLQYQSDLYADATEEIFTTTTIPVLSMTWLGLKWLAE